MKRASLRYKNTPAVLQVCRPAPHEAGRNRALERSISGELHYSIRHMRYSQLVTHASRRFSALDRGYLMTHQSRYKSCAVDMLCYLFEVSPPTAIAMSRFVLWAFPGFMEA